MNKITSLQTRVAIADDHQLVCAAVTQLLQLDPRIKVVAQAHDGPSAEALIKAGGFDVLLLDLQMRGRHGLELLRSLYSTPSTLADLSVCVLSAHTDSHFIVEAIRAGASGYISKQAAPEELLQAILAIARGESYFSADVRQAALAFGTKGLHKGLTLREQEVLRLCAVGLSSADVTSRLNISRRTAEAHRANLMKKLSLKTQTDLIRYALRHGIIDQDFQPQPHSHLPLPWNSCLTFGIPSLPSGDPRYDCVRVTRDPGAHRPDRLSQSFLLPDSCYSNLKVVSKKRRICYPTAPVPQDH